MATEFILKLNSAINGIMITKTVVPVGAHSMLEKYSMAYVSKNNSNSQLPAAIESNVYIKTSATNVY